MNTDSHAHTCLFVAHHILASELRLAIKKWTGKNSSAPMTGLWSSKHRVAQSQFPFERKRLIRKAARSPTRCTVHFIHALGGSGDKTTSLERVCLHSRSDTLPRTTGTWLGGNVKKDKLSHLVYLTEQMSLLPNRLQMGVLLWTTKWTPSVFLYDLVAVRWWYDLDHPRPTCLDCTVYSQVPW